jgi:hypothetical protein
MEWAQARHTTRAGSQQPADRPEGMVLWYLHDQLQRQRPHWSIRTRGPSGPDKARMTGLDSGDFLRRRTQPILVDMQVALRVQAFSPRSTGLVCAGGVLCGSYVSPFS